MAEQLVTIEDIVHEYHTQRVSSNTEAWLSSSDAKELILAIVARDMILEGGTLTHLEYEPCEKSS